MLKHLLLFLSMLAYGVSFSQTETVSVKDSTSSSNKSHIQSIQGEVLKKACTTNSLTSLAGRFAGVSALSSSGNFGGGTRVLIRGARSFAGDNQPLYVVNGMPISNADYSALFIGSQVFDLGSMASDLNIWDIDSISIVPPSLSAAYGYRGRNGVVDIKTNHIQLTHGFKLGVVYNTDFTFDKIAIYPKFQKLYGGGSSNTFNTINIGGVDYLTPQYMSDMSWGPKYNSSILVLPWNAYDSWDLENYMSTTPWIYPKNDYTSFFETAAGYQNNIQVNLSSQIIAANIAYTNIKQNGVYPNSSSVRNYLSVNTIINPVDFVRMNASFTYLTNNTDGRPAIGNSLSNNLASMWNWTQTSIDYSSLKSYINPNGSQRTWNRTAWNNPEPFYEDNVYWERYKNGQSDEHDRFFGNIALDIDLLKWLTFKSKVGFEKYDLSSNGHVAKGAAYTSSYALYKGAFKETNADFALQSNNHISDNIGILSSIGTSSVWIKNSTSSATTSGGLIIDGIYDISNSVGPAMVINSWNKEEIRSFYLDAVVNYKKLIYLNGLFREDDFNGIVDNSQKTRSSSIGVNFIASELSFIKGFNLISSARIYSNYTNYTRELKTSYDLDPSKENHLDIGIDISLFNNQFNFDLRRYCFVNKNQLFPINDMMGNTHFFNVNGLNTNGFELILSGKLEQQTSISWNYNIAITTYSSKVEKFENIDAISLDVNYFDSNISANVNKPFPVIMGTDFVYDSKGNKIVSTSGRYLTSEIKPLANVAPTITLGISNSFSYKNISLDVLFDIQRGGHILYTSNMIGMSSGILEETAKSNENGVNIRESIANGGGVLLNGVYGRIDLLTGDVIYTDAGGDDSPTPVSNTIRIDGKTWATDYINGPTSQSVFSSDFIKLRELSISYKFRLKSFPLVKGVKVSIFGRNLAMWGAATKHFDPEYVSVISSNAQGREVGYLPSLRTYGFNLSLSF